MGKKIIWDIENVPMILADFSLYRQGMHNYDNVLQESFMICVCWKELGKGKIHSVSLLDDPKRFKADPTDDYHVVKTIRDLFDDDIDLLIGHNIINFDWKILNTRMISHGLDPLPKPRMADTLRMARREFKFPSNKLDSIAKYLGEGAKIITPKGLWIDTLMGKRKAVKDMVDYCKGDINISETIYLRLRPYDRLHPNLSVKDGLIKDGEIPTTKDLYCPKCGEKGKLIKQGIATLNSGRYQKYQCRADKCRGWSRGRRNMDSKASTGVAVADKYLHSQ